MQGAMGRKTLAPHGLESVPIAWVIINECNKTIPTFRNPLSLICTTRSHLIKAISICLISRLCLVKISRNFTKTYWCSEARTPLQPTCILFKQIIFIKIWSDSKTINNNRIRLLELQTPLFCLKLRKISKFCDNLPMVKVSSLRIKATYSRERLNTCIKRDSIIRIRWRLSRASLTRMTVWKVRGSQIPPLLRLPRALT
jgi:hypothetical protein